MYLIFKKTSKKLYQICFMRYVSPPKEIRTDTVLQKFNVIYYITQLIRH